MAKAKAKRKTAARKRGPAAKRKRLPEVRGQARLRRHPGASARRGRALGGPTFMVHKHDASRLHYDLRLEMDGALASLGGAQGPELRPDGQAPRGPDRGSPARIRQLRGAHPGRRVRRGRFADLGPRHLRHGAARASVAAAQEGPPASGPSTATSCRAVAPRAHARAGRHQVAVALLQGAATSSPTTEVRRRRRSGRSRW